MKTLFTNPKFFLLLLIGSFSFALSVDAQTWQWGKRGGGAFNGLNPDRESVVDIATDNSGNIYSLATVEASSPPNVDGQPITTYGDKDIVVSSFNCSGAYRWSKVIGGASGDKPISLRLDNMGNVYVITRTYNQNSLVQNVHFGNDTIQQNNNRKTLSLVKYDSSGNFQWLRQPEADTSTSNFIANKSKSFDIHVDLNGEVYWLVQLPPGLISGGNGWVNPNEATYILKYNSAGAILSHTLVDIEIKGAGINPLRFNRTQTGDFLLLGSNTSSTNGLLKIAGNAIPTYLFLAAFNNLGQNLWYKTNTLSNLATRAIDRPLIDGNGNIYIAGIYRKNDIFNGFTFPATSSSSHFLSKLKSNGDPIWTKTANSNAVPQDALINFKNGSEIWLTGSSPTAIWDNNHYVQGAFNGGYFIYVATFDTSGSILALDSLKGNFGSNNYALCSTTDPNGNLVVGGNFNSQLYVGNTTLTSSGGLSDFFVAKYGYNCNCTPPTAGYNNTVSSSGTTVTFTYTGTTVLDSLRWQFGDGQSQLVTSNFTSPVTHVYATSGNYTPCARVYNNCGNDSHCKNVSVSVGVANSKLPGVSIYPNPATSYLTIEGLEGGHATMSNNLGQVVKDFAITDYRTLTDMRELPTGIYFLELRDAQGNREVVKVVR